MTAARDKARSAGVRVAGLLCAPKPGGGTLDDPSAKAYFSDDDESPARQPERLRYTSAHLLMLDQEDSAAAPPASDGVLPGTGSNVGIDEALSKARAPSWAPVSRCASVLC